MQVFSGHGFAGATIDAIADAAGFTKGAVYSNFGSKDDLFFALLDDQIERRREAVTILAESVPNPTAEQLGRLLTAQMRSNRDWQLLFTEYWLRAMRDPEIHARFVEHRRALRASIETIVRQLDNATDMDPSHAAILVLALNNGLSIEEFSDPGAVPAAMLGDVLQAISARAD